jgi:hypothetical protein
VNIGRPSGDVDVTAASIIDDAVGFKRDHGRAAE